jgi:hypothetical protein
MSVGVFVSYNHSDMKVADALVEALTSLSPSLDVFIDHSGLQSADDYEAKISESIGRSQWFIIICSGRGRSDKDMSWCFYEAGQFRAKLQATDLAKTVRDRICFLYDVDRPSQLGRYQGHRVSDKTRNKVALNFRLENDDSLSYEETELFEFFKTILTKSAAEPLRDLNDASVRKLMRGGVRRLTLAFADNGEDEIIDEEVFQPRISFRVSAAEANGVKPDTPIFGEFNALPNIFSIASPNATWSDIKTRAARISPSGLAPLWIVDLENAIIQVAEGGVPHQTDFLCFGNDGKFYRPIIARNEIYKSGNKKCYIAFIPSRDRRFDLSYRTSLLLSTLILSVRFRQRVLPLVTDLNKEIPEKRKAEILQRLSAEIILVESEAVEFGLEPPKNEYDDPPILNSFRDGEAKEFIRAEIANWSNSRAAIFEIIKAAQNPEKETSWSDAAKLVSQQLGSLRSVNGSFIDKLCRELMYAEKIE